MYLWELCLETVFLDRAISMLTFFQVSLDSLPWELSHFALGF